MSVTDKFTVELLTPPALEVSLLGTQVIYAGAPPVTNADVIEIQQANNFTPLSILKHTTGWALAQANSLANADIWLCVEATPTSFKVASTCRIYEFPSHNLGADNTPLFLSPTTAGRATSTPPMTGQFRVIVGVIFDADRIFWNPELTAEVV
jgi:hypothetical protein